MLNAAEMRERNQLAIKCAEELKGKTGCLVIVTRDNGQDEYTTITREPWHLGGGHIVIGLLGFSGGYDVTRVRLAGPAPIVPAFDSTSGRWTIAGRQVHCGDCFQIRAGNGPWLDVRAEHNAAAGWYLVGIPQSLKGRDWSTLEARWYD